jgi:protein TonB
VTAFARDRAAPWLWVASAVMVLGLHAAGGMLLLGGAHEPDIGEPGAIYFDLAPFTTPPSDTVEDLAPGPRQQEAAPQPAAEKRKVTEKIDEKVDVPPAPVPPVAAPAKPEPIDPKPPEPAPVAPAPVTTAPPRQHASPAQISTWHTGIVRQLERNKSYPPAAQKRGEAGEVEVAFTIDRQGRVLASAITKSSGSATLDQAAIATLRRAQPFPAPPVELDGERFDFTVPVKFNIR